MSPPDLHHVVQTVEDVLPCLFGLDPHLGFMFCGRLGGTGPEHGPCVSQAKKVQKVPAAECSC